MNSVNYKKTNETLEAIVHYMISNVSHDHYAGVREIANYAKASIAEEQFIDTLRLFLTMPNYAEGAQNLQKILLKYDKNGVHHPAIKQLSE